jgi:hypothetical protein
MGLGAVLFGEVGWTRPSRDVRVLCEGSAAALVGLMAVPRMPVPRMPVPVILALPAVQMPSIRSSAAPVPRRCLSWSGTTGLPLTRSLRRLVSQNVQLAGFALSGFALAFVTAGQALAASRRPHDDGH